MPLEAGGLSQSDENHIRVGSDSVSDILRPNKSQPQMPVQLKQSSLDIFS